MGGLSSRPVRSGACGTPRRQDLAGSRKRIHGYAGPAPADAAPHCDEREVDRAQFIPIERARLLLHPAQVPFLDRLLSTLDMEGATPHSPDPPRDVGST